MKTLLLTSAIMSIGALAPVSAAQIGADTLIPSLDFSQVYAAVNITETAEGLHTGDYQAKARSVQARSLYNGTGAALMGSIRMNRY